MEHKISDYYILVQKRNAYARFAAGEMRYFIQKCCGFSMEILPEKKPDGHFVSIGFYGGEVPSGFPAGKIPPLGEDGYVIYTVDSDYYIAGGGEHGAVYGTYGLLKELISLEFYAFDVFDYKKISFKEVNLVSVPDIPVRALGIAPYHDETIDGPPDMKNLRMRFSRMTDGWGVCSHSYFKILPPSVYKEEHPDWYSQGDGGVNLCLTNPGMRERFIENYKKVLAEHPDDRFFMIGQQDTVSFCDCPACKDALIKAGGFNSVLMIDFTNEVVRRLNLWLEKEMPGRSVTFCMFAYSRTILPPVVEKDGELFPIRDFRLEKNLAVMLAPLHSNSTYSYFDGQNYESMDTKYVTDKKVSVTHLIEGWRKITDNIFFWSYSLDNFDWLVPFDMWDTMKENFLNYKKYNIRYLFEEGSYHTVIPNFNALRAYLFSNIMWDSGADTEKLKNKFFDFYYGKNNSKEMKSIFGFLHKYISGRIAADKRPMLYVKYDDFDDLGSVRYWEYEVLLDLKNRFDRLIESADGIYKELIKDESLSVNYLLFLLYRDRLDENLYENTRKTVLEIVLKYDMLKEREGMWQLLSIKDKLLTPYKK